MRRTLALCLLLLAPGWAIPLAPEHVRLSHPRELRGAWVASVNNINFPSQSGMPPENQKLELLKMLDCLQQARFNAVFFQIRPEGDALYQSALEPWSRFLGGLQGQDPGYDPLRFMVEEAHLRNIEVHAWLNPYRARGMPVTGLPPVSPHMETQEPDHVFAYGQFRWMDPGAPGVRQRLVSVCRDLAGRYDIDGIHFDDYFYPYPEGQSFPDDATWAAYQSQGGSLSRADWRRDNVNQAILEVSQAVRQESDHVRFGVSPFGLPAPGRPADIEGFDQYEKLYADTQRWMDQGWVDYLAPQLYWPTTRKPQAFRPLLQWWAEHRRPGHYIFAGINLASLGTKPEWSLEEYRQQFGLVRANAPRGCQGYICWNISPLLENRLDVQGEFGRLQPHPALTPPLARGQLPAVPAPCVDQEGRAVKLRYSGPPLRAWTVYRYSAGVWQLEKILPGTQEEVELTSGQWAIAAASMHGVEGPAQIIRVR